MKNLLMIDIEDTSLSAEDRELIGNPLVGGVILFTRNFVDTAQLKSLVEEIRAARTDCLIAVDQEGGHVQRFQTGFTRLPPMQRLGDLYGNKPQLALTLTRDIGWLMAVELLVCGIDISFAPVLDVDRESSSVIGDRSFSDQPGAVTHLGGAFMSGMHEAGMAAIGKHFPGHGGVVADSHLEAPVDLRDYQCIATHDLLPFKALAKQLDGMMPAHVTYPKVDKHPAGFSAYWLQKVLRKQLGFTGMIFSDDLSMKGANVIGSYTEKAQAALLAGCNTVLLCHDRQGVLEVLDSLDTLELKCSNRLSTLHAKKVWDLEELAASGRLRRTRRSLNEYF